MNEVVNWLAKDRFSTYLGVELVHLSKGYAFAKVSINDTCFNAHNIAHGGLIHAVADYACAAAANSHGYVSLSINNYISFHKSPEGNVIFAEAREVARGDRLSSVSVTVTDENSNLIACMTSNVYVTREKIGAPNVVINEEAWGLNSGV